MYCDILVWNPSSPKTIGLPRVSCNSKKIEYPRKAAAVLSLDVSIQA